MPARLHGVVRRRPGLWLAGAGVLLGMAPLGTVGASASAAAGAATATARPNTSGTGAPAVVTAASSLTLDQWKQRYEHDVGILADDVLVVVDDGKRAQTHITKAKVKTTVKDCRQWATDATTARSAAPPIPMASAQKAWTSMIAASFRAASECVNSLQTGSGNPKNFRKQLAIVEKDEAALVSDLNG
jgi:hypothetical protein